MTIAMRLRRSKCRGLFLVAALLASVIPSGAHAAGTLIALSSAAFNSASAMGDWGQSVTIDGSGNIIMTGYKVIDSDGDYLTVKYDANFNFISSAVYDASNGAGSDQAYGIAADRDGNSIVTGISDAGGGLKWLTIKYDPNLQMLSSATYTAGSGTNWAYDVATDSMRNIIVTGSSRNGSYTDMYTIKYDANLQPLLSASYNGSANKTDWGRAIAVDASDNIIAAGYINNGAGGGIIVIKYDPDMQVVSSATYHTAGAFDEAPYDVAIDPSGNIVVAGYTVHPGGTYGLALKYDRDLRLLSSVERKDFHAQGIASDGSANVIVAGYISDGPNYDFVTLRYDPNLVLLASATYNGPANSFDAAYGVAVDSSNNIIGAGSSRSGSHLDYFAIKYNGLPPVVTSCTPGSGTQGETLDVVLQGSYFLPGAVASFNAPGITVNSVVRDSPTQVRANITLAISPSAGARNAVVTNTDSISGTLAGGFVIVKKPAPSLVSVYPSSGPLAGGTTVAMTGTDFLSGAAVTFGGTAAAGVVYISSTAIEAVTPAGALPGMKDIIVLNPDDQSSLLAGGFSYDPLPVASSTVIDPAVGGTAGVMVANGYIGVTVPAGTFGQSVVLTISSAAVQASSGGTIRTTGVGVEVSNSAGLQPEKEIMLTVYYRDQDIAGLDESKLALARYDNGGWIPIPTVVFTADNKLVGTVKHLSTFAIVQLAPAADLAGVKAYPNPLRNGSMIIANLTGEAEIKIFTVAGELVRKLEYVSADGRAAWDGKNDSGNTVASGVYLAFIKSDSGKRIIKIAVER